MSPSDELSPSPNEQNMASSPAGDQASTSSPDEHPCVNEHESQTDATEEASPSTVPSVEQGAPKPKSESDNTKTESETSAYVDSVVDGNTTNTQNEPTETVKTLPTTDTNQPAPVANDSQTQNTGDQASICCHRDEASSTPTKHPSLEFKNAPSPVTSNNSLPHEDNDIRQLDDICQGFAGCDDEVLRSQSCEYLMKLLVTDDMLGIRSVDTLRKLFTHYLHSLPPRVLSELLSVLVAIVKKSVFYLESVRGLIIPCIDYLISDANNNVKRSQNLTPGQQISSASSVSLTKHFLREWVNLLIAHSCDVEELRVLIKYSEQDPSLLSFIQQANLKQRSRPSAFFALPGTRGSMISLPPFQKWPTQTGWSFSTWFFLEPKVYAQPYLFNFKTGKSGLGYSAHFTGNCLVLTSIRVKGKGIQHCVPYEFPSYKWIHCAITYHNKWRATEIKVYVNGQLAANIDMPWQVQTSEAFDKCFIGGSGSITKQDRSGELNCFCGQMSAIYLFNEGLSPVQICAIHRLGPSYVGQFKYSNESQFNLPPQIHKALYKERLSSSVFCLYTPIAVDSGTLCIQLASFKSSISSPAQNYFLSSPHAALVGQTKAIKTQPIIPTLQSIGCSKSLIPLFDVFVQKADPEACASLIEFLCDLLKSSPNWFANEIVQNNGFVVVAQALSTNARSLISEKLLDTFLNLTQTLLSTATTTSDSVLLKHFVDNILLNPQLWVYADPKLQLKLYRYIATDFLHGARNQAGKHTTNRTASHPTYIPYNPTSSAALALSNEEYADIPEDQPGKNVSTTESTNILMTDLLFNEIRRVSMVLQSLHALKHYYWVQVERWIHAKPLIEKLRPGTDDIHAIRSYILQFIKELTCRACAIPFDEIQGFLNYLWSCSREENLLDVMGTLVSLLREHPSTMVTALDQRKAIKVIFELLSSDSEKVRVKALRMLAVFLSQCDHKRKQNIMAPNNLFMLIYDRLRPYAPLTMETYEALIDIMIENCDFHRPRPRDCSTRDLSKEYIFNSTIVKVIAMLIHDERMSNHESLTIDGDTDSSTPNLNSPDIRRVFLNDLWNLIVMKRENRRTILQMSVWQQWLINLIDSTVTDSPLVRDQVLAIFRVLLYQAIRYELGGWRVWIDTLAIMHTKISYDEFDCHTERPSKKTGLPSSSKEIKGESATNNEIPDASKETPNTTQSKNEDENSRLTIVSSISERVPRGSSGIQMDGTNAETSDNTEDCSESAEFSSKQAQDDAINTATDGMKYVDSTNETTNPAIGDARDENDGSLTGTDTIDLAPSRAYRKNSLPKASNETITYEEQNNESMRRVSLDSIPLDDDNDIDQTRKAELNTSTEPEAEINHTSQHEETHVEPSPSPKAQASPAFRIPEFRWSNVLVKLLNDTLFSIECDLYNWRVSAKCTDQDAVLFSTRAPKTSASSKNTQNDVAHSSSSRSASSSIIVFETILQRPDNQLYLVNLIHIISQVADNVIIAAGGLLPLLAEATGGSRSTRTNQPAAKSSASAASLNLCEGLTMAQANSLLYRLVAMVDIVVFAAAHINLAELEADRNTTSGAILRQCLRLVCTVTVKNCLILQSVQQKLGSVTENSTQLSSVELPRDTFDGYLGCSLLSANGLFENSPLPLDGASSDLVASPEYTPHQMPDSSSMPSVLPFQTNPIRDSNKLIQNKDIARLQACIYHELNTDTRQSQFMALSSLYFISVLMVSKYRDIIEPRKPRKSLGKPDGSLSTGIPEGGQERGTLQSGSNAESSASTSNRFPSSLSSSVGQPSSSALTDMLTRTLENTLDTICPLLKRIMCDFCGFLSKTLVGSHGQDLVNKEADRTFRRPDTNPVELVMLLCSQEWQNTLQKNAGLAFIELINEGRILSHGMKDHIVRVGMEAEFILSRLRADDVAKHEHFQLTSAEVRSSRLHEEKLINSLIATASRRDLSIYNKFQENLRYMRMRNFKLDVWEDDDRRKRRFVADTWPDTAQQFYTNSSSDSAVVGAENVKQANSASGTVTSNDKIAMTDTRRILDLQRNIEQSGAQDHCSPSGAALSSDHRIDIKSNSVENELEYEAEDDYDYDLDPERDDAEGLETGEIAHADAPEVDADRLDSGATPPSSQDKTDMGSGQPGRNRTITRGNSARSGADQTRASRTEGRPNQWVDYEDCSSVIDFAGTILFATDCSLIWGIYAIPGVLQLTSQELYFEPNQNIGDAIDQLRRDAFCPEAASKWSMRHDSNEMITLKNNHGQARGNGDVDSSSHSLDRISLRLLDLKALSYCEFLTGNSKIHLADIRAIFTRQYLLQPHALEIFIAQRTSVMFAFNNFDTVKRAIKSLPPVGVGIKYGIKQSRRASLMTPRQLFAASNMTQKWQKREIGNFQYLMFLNTIAGRTYQDLNQYPVYPWILTNYETEELDLNLPTNFRDLSKPIGALNNKRRSEFVERYQTWDNPKVPAFHYGTHYSTAAFTLNWLCRLRGTYNSCYLALQDGKYEEQSRLFLSIGDSWVSSLTGGQQNVKELIPEFFYLPEMFHSNLGLPQVEFPPWAKGSAEQFVRLHRLALESELVSCQLHQWIDLIFGYKQRGPEAINAVNTFYYLTYQGNVNLNMIQDPSLRDAIETQIKHFGQTPSQLTTEPHSPRFSALHVSPMIFASSKSAMNHVLKFPFKTSITHISPCMANYTVNQAAAGAPSSAGDAAHAGNIQQPSNGNSPSSLMTVTSNQQYQIHKWSIRDQSGQPLSLDPQLTSASPRRQLIDTDDLCTSVSLKIQSIFTGALTEDSCAPNSTSVNDNQLDEVRWACANYIVTLDGRHILVASFYDNSFRVFTTDSGRLCQVVYGHSGPITCMTRGEFNATADFHLATGGRDCSVLLWCWNEHYKQVEGSGVSSVQNPLPKLTISGHRSAVLSVKICSELGLLISGSKNLILVHSITSGENFIEITIKLPRIFDRSLAGANDQASVLAEIQRPQLKDRQKTILEASMLGEDSQNLKVSPKPTTNSRTPSISSLTSDTLGNKFAHLRELLPSDCYITNLQLARELGFIVCVALPPPKRKTKIHPEVDTSQRFPAALLMTFNLKGMIMDSTTIGQAVNGPRLGDVCLLQTSPGGEFLILNDSPTTLKIYRTFDLQAIYAYNTNDLPQTLTSEDRNQVRSLALVDNKYVIVGLDTGKMVVYHADSKTLQ